MVNWLKYILNVYTQTGHSKGHLECLKDLKAQIQKSALPLTVVYLGKFLFFFFNFIFKPETLY